MVILMGMESGRFVANEFGAFEEEVLNAQWLPQPPELQLGLQEAMSSKATRPARVVDAEAFFRNVYLNQE